MNIGIHEKVSNGEINHVQVTKLDENTANKNTMLKHCKQTFGKINGHAVNLNHTGEGDITFLTEGVETGLSILEVNPKARVLTVLGKENFASINTEQLTKHVILCVDNDGKNTFKYQKNHTNNVLLAINRMEESGIKITINIPKNNGEDLNDILLNHGRNALSEALKSTITPHEYKKICDKENGILPEIKSETNQYRRDKLDQKPSLMANIKDNNLMKSSLIKQLKNDSMNQTTKRYPPEKSAVMSDKMPAICQKEMEREL